jgi:hypothetical protein
VEDVPIGVPASTLRTPYVPGAIAVDAHDTLYVADQAADSVDAYLPGAKGRAQPERVLSLARTPKSLALDAQGYLYVGETQAVVEIFAPAASGKATPVSVITLAFTANATIAVNVDAGGRLFAAQNTAGGSYVAEYADPKTAPFYQRALDGIANSYPFIGIDGLATDVTGELYVSQSAWPQVWAFSETACCGYPADRLIGFGSPGNIVPVAVAVRGRHMFWITGTPFTPVIHVLDILRATQVPLETVSGPFLKNPVAAAVTP